MGAGPSWGSQADYLEFERSAKHRHGYLDGQMVVMAGGSGLLSRICANLLRILGTALKGHPCEPFTSDLRVRSADLMLYTYPDVTVARRPEFEDDRGDVLLNPKVIFEELSPSTEAFDRGEKFRRYRAIPSLAEYVLVAQDGLAVEVFARKADGIWSLSDYQGPDAVARLESPDMSLPLRDVFDRVQFEPDAPATSE